VGGGHEHGPVAGDVGLAREHVHTLSPRDPRHELEREERRALLGRLAAGVGRGERVAEADDHEAGTDAVAVGAPRVAAGAGRANREHAVGGKHGIARHDLGAGCAVGVVGEAGGNARAALDENLNPARQRATGLLQGRDGGRHEGHAPLPRECLFRDGNLHGGTACGRRNEQRESRGSAASVIRGTEAGNTAAGCRVSAAERGVFGLRRVASRPLAGVSGHW